MRKWGLPTFLLLVLLTGGLAAPVAPVSSTPGSKPDGVVVKTPWSDAVDGMEARLEIDPNVDPTLDRTYNFRIVFHESGGDTSLGIQHVARSIHFSVTAVSAQVTDAKGGPAETLPLVDQPAPPAWDLVLPPDGEVDFPIGHGGSSPHQAPGITPKGKLFHLDTGNEWTMLPDKGPYKVVVTLNITEVPNPPIKGAKGWTGALSLPAIALPVD